jgi:DNA-binding transcriptional regulator GbsR (MarR family)
VSKKEKLVERLGVHLENKEQIAPLAARILSKLILTGRRGITFEDLVCDLCASKSTISSHLTNLQATQRVTYFTKPGDRKKYFILSPDAMIKSMTEMLQNWELESVLHREVMVYKEEITSS